MPTPSSDATSPSPTMPFSPPLPLPPTATEQDERKRAVQKFKARAEISNVTRNLRVRLSYASYKATHNLSHLPLRELEAQTQNQPNMYSRSSAAKRKMSALNLTPGSYSASGPNNYYNNPATQGGLSPGPIPIRRHGSMAPPPPLTFRSYYPVPNHATPAGPDAQRAIPAQSLFASILAPPPSQPARTIHNAADPPVPAPLRPTPSPRSGKSARSIAEGTRAMAKASSRHDRPEKRKAKSRHSLDKGKGKQRRHAVDADGDVDMKAAATLTSLLLHHRPSIGSAGSPRSSLDGSDAGSVHSYGAQFTQSSARGGPPPNPDAAAAASTSAQPAAAAAAPELRHGSATPPPTLSQESGPGQATTPRPAPTDNEAADLMLFLATSPSPVRNSKNKDQRDLAAYRALHGGGSGAARPRGRVLFPTAGSLAESDGVPRASGSGSGSGLRGADSFASSVSSIGGEMRGSGSRTGTPVSMPAESSTTTQTQLLPPPLSPAPSPKPVYGQLPPQQVQAAAPQPTQQQPAQPQPHQAQQGEFDFSIYVRGSPSPRPGSASGGRISPNSSASGVSVTQAPTQPAAAPQKANLGLRADVGRKLFEEEQMRQQQQQQQQAAALSGQMGGMQGMGMSPMQMHGHGHGSSGKARAAQEEQQRPLGAGIDLVQST